MFEMPEIKVTRFAVEDVITVSGDGNGNGGNDDQTQLPDEELP